MVLAMGALAAGSPAFADNVGVTVNSRFVPFNPGDTQLLKITVTSRGAPWVAGSVSGLSVSGLLGGNAIAAVDVTRKRPQPTQAPSVPQVSGVVRDMATGSPIGKAVVVVVDGGACASGKDPCQLGTDNSGAFNFTSSPNKPITPGTLRIVATKNGYDSGAVTVDARAGQSVNVPLKLKPNAAASSSATAEALPSAEGQQPTADVVAPTEAAAAAPAPKPAGNSGPSAISWIVFVLAGLLVLAGVGMFAVMFLNSRKGDADEDADGNPPSGLTGAPMGAGPGVYGGSADRADPTMVGNPGMASAMASPGASDSTAILRQQRPEGEFPDRYAAAYPASPAGYPQAGDRYGAPADPYATQVGRHGVSQPAGYDSATQGYGGAPSAYGPGGEYGAGAGYAAPPAVYSPDQSYGSAAGSPRYDEATRHWNGGADGGYTGDWAHSQQQGDYEAGRGQQQHGGGYDPYQQQQSAEAPARRGAPQARHGGDR
jgi:hypothetical protein